MDAGLLLLGGLLLLSSSQGKPAAAMPEPKPMPADSSDERVRDWLRLVSDITGQVVDVATRN